MYKIYTPKAWYSTFSYPTLFVEDDGLIYSETDYHKSFRNAVGKIDSSSGLIYGADYFKSFAQPIGKLERRSDGVIQIYGSDYHRLSAQPTFYIEENRIYSAEEFYKTFRQEAGIIQKEPPNPPTPPDPPKRRVSDDGKKMILTAAIAAIFMIAATIWVFTDVDYAQPTVIMLAVGAVLALIFAKSYSSSVITILCTCGVIMFAYDYILTTSHKTLEIGELIISILLWPFAICLAYLIPSLIVGGIVWLVKRPFVKNQEEAKEDTTSN